MSSGAKKSGCKYQGYANGRMSVVGIAQPQTQFFTQLLFVE
jgi:hypothetical protein